VKRLFRKVENKSADYDPTHPGTVRREGSYIYEQFLTTGGTDVKVGAGVGLGCRRFWGADGQDGAGLFLAKAEGSIPATRAPRWPAPTLWCHPPTHPNCNTGVHSGAALCPRGGQEEPRGGRQSEPGRGGERGAPGAARAALATAPAVRCLLHALQL